MPLYSSSPDPLRLNASMKTFSDRLGNVLHVILAGVSPRRYRGDILLLTMDIRGNKIRSRYRARIDTRVSLADTWQILLLL